MPAVVVARPSFLAACALAFGLAVVNFGLMYAIPGTLSVTTDWSADRIGLAMVWPLLLGGLVSWPVAAVSTRLGHRTMVTVLVALAVLGVAAATRGTGLPVLLAAQAAASVAAASGQAVLGARAAGVSPADEMPSALGLFTLCYLLGAAFGPAVGALATG
ncbi:MFS transporter [Streptomyces sp. NPDC059202]|uniref:MFS transporter n=1 Tax=Streptomyces sp. NPDC059202 TaxID=3346768 RepID=UPI0036A19740